MPVGLKVKDWNFGTLINKMIKVIPHVLENVEPHIVQNMFKTQINSWLKVSSENINSHIGKALLKQESVKKITLKYNLSELSI